MLFIFFNAYFSMHIFQLVMRPATKFTPLQHELLKIFSFNPSEQELYDIKNLIARYYAKKADTAMDEFMQQFGIPEAIREQYEKWSVEHLRTPYNS
jgi:hypothetical protein